MITLTKTFLVFGIRVLLEIDPSFNCECYPGPNNVCVLSRDVFFKNSYIVAHVTEKNLYEIKYVKDKVKVVCKKEGKK